MEAEEGTVVYMMSGLMEYRSNLSGGGGNMSLFIQIYSWYLQRMMGY